MRRDVKERRFLLLRNGDKLSEKERARLERPRSVNQNLVDAYEHKEELRRICG